ncbi:hypothetical protein FHS96_002802 [Sphingomonas zeicaulis]|uniref:CC0125/CC1285 family lipoprotein n=1 Tax=Sphingomonas zeicaulis TaxID=1632740 RepID=UPI003D1BFAB0
MQISVRALLICAASTLTLGVMGCTTATPYQPISSRGGTAGGYSDQRIEDNRYRVSFVGNTMTSRETVETFLLYRAAELTTAQGYDWFVMADRDTEKKSRTTIDRPFTAGPYGYWGPSWRYRGSGFGWRGWDPFWGDPFWDRQVDMRTVDRYEATAEIVLGRGSKPANDVRAFDARQILANLGPRIVTPS